MTQTNNRDNQQGQSTRTSKKDKQQTQATKTTDMFAGLLPPHGQLLRGQLLRAHLNQLVGLDLASKNLAKQALKLNESSPDIA